ncbi:MAG: YdeI/OmpD-associated family protein [Bacteroidales bacterium]|nr:YdeI/OmpD-associated family protein [Bacteroidales bacterium]MBN2762887.1 YdeI/OmpD-associated family protein [Bacteroidales bacterium]
MEITETLYVTDREQWRSWLEKNHTSAKEIWLIYYNKKSGKPRIPYNDAVEEALCFGWIDSIVKKYDKDRAAQRFSPRRKNSKLSELNKERIRRLIETGKMTPAGLESIKHHLENNDKDKKKNFLTADFQIPEDIFGELQKDKTVWNNFQKFPEHYKRVRIGWIDGSRQRPEVFQQRLRYFLRMTAKNKTFGMMR